jgi:enoyl-CoA hydratase
MAVSTMTNVSSVTLNPVGSILSIILENTGNGDRIGQQTAASLREAFDFFETNDSLHALVITGSNGNFSEGSTLSPIEISTFTGLKTDLIIQHQVASHLSRITKPTIAAVDGKAHGQGLEIALACDIRIASTNSSFGFPESQLGLIPWDGGTQRLPRLIGLGLATQMLFTGKPITAEKALNAGLVTEIMPSKELARTASEISERIVSSGSIAAKYIKEAIKSSGDLPLREGFRLEADLNMLLFSTKDRSEGISSFLEKRAPNFNGS